MAFRGNYTLNPLNTPSSRCCPLDTVQKSLSDEGSQPCQECFGRRVPVVSLQCFSRFSKTYIAPQPVDITQVLQGKKAGKLAITVPLKTRELLLFFLLLTILKGDEGLAERCRQSGITVPINPCLPKQLF